MIRNIVSIIVGIAVLAALSNNRGGSSTASDDPPAGWPKGALFHSESDESSSTTVYRDKIVVKNPLGSGTIRMNDVEKVTRKNLTVRIFSRDGSNIEMRFHLLLDAKRFEEMIEKQL